MLIETKFNLGDGVWPISTGGVNVKTQCETCKGAGSVSLVESLKRITCPDCRGVGYFTEWRRNEWAVSSEFGIIGKIIIGLYAGKYLLRGDEDERRYMLSSTGVGSGTLWSEDNLFLNRADAEAECKRRNGVNN